MIKGMAIASKLLVIKSLYLDMKLGLYIPRTYYTVDIAIDLV